MAKIIQLKRGLITNVAGAVLKEGEAAIAFDEEKKAAQLWIGTGENDGKGKICVNPDITSELQGILTEAEGYTDTKVKAAIDGLVDGAPEAYNTLKEISDYIATHTTEYEALQALVGDKLTKPTADGTQGQILSLDADGKLVWKDDKDTTYSEATQSGTGLMSAQDKEKLDGVETGAQVNTVTGVKGSEEETYRTGKINLTKANLGLGNVDNTADMDKPVSTAMKTALDGKLDADADIDCGTF